MSVTQMFGIMSTLHRLLDIKLKEAVLYYCIHATYWMHLCDSFFSSPRENLYSTIDSRNHSMMGIDGLIAAGELECTEAVNDAFEGHAYISFKRYRSSQL